MEAVLLLLEEGHRPETVSRPLYVMYAAAKALLAAKDAETKTHPGLKRRLGLLYVKEGLFDRAHIRAYDRAFKNRMRADYDGQSFTEAEARWHLAQARHFVAAAEELLT